MGYKSRVGENPEHVAYKNVHAYLAYLKYVVEYLKSSITRLA